VNGERLLAAILLAALAGCAGPGAETPSDLPVAGFPEGGASRVDEPLPTGDAPVAEPAAEPASTRESTLKEAIAGADRVVLRTGGTCHREEARERVLFQSEDPVEIRRVSGLLVVMESSRPGRCMCCGGPTIEFRRDGTLLADLGLQHGALLRWPGGWHGDGPLTIESREALAHWLADHGSTEALDQWERDRGEVLARGARWRMLYSRMPPALVAVFEKGTDPDGFLAALREILPDPVDRAVLALRLHGTGEGTWIKNFGLDYALEEKVFPDLGPGTLREAVGAVPIDPALADGAARWVFEGELLKDLLPAMAARVLPVIGERALAHPRVYNRRQTLSVLGGYGSEEALVLLRRFFRGEIPHRALDPDLVEEYFDGYLPPQLGDIYMDFSDRAYAALLLARLDDRECLEEIRSMRATAPPEDELALDEALDLLSE